MILLPQPDDPYSAIVSASTEAIPYTMSIRKACERRDTQPSY